MSCAPRFEEQCKGGWPKEDAAVGAMFDLGTTSVFVKCPGTIQLEVMRVRENMPMARGTCED